MGSNRYILSTTPDVLVYLFPDYFSPRKRFGGVSVSPIRDVKVDAEKLYRSMVLAELLYYYYMGEIDLQLVKEGFLVKKNRIYVRKLKDLSLKNGSLGRIIDQLMPGESISLEDLIVNRYFVEQNTAPERLYIMNVSSLEPYKNTVLRLSEPGYIDQLEKQATWLNNLLSYYASQTPDLYRSIIEEAANATKKAYTSELEEEEEEEYYWYEEE